MEFIKFSGTRRGRSDKNISAIYYVRLDTEDKNRIESDIAPDVYFIGNTYYVSLFNFFAVTGRKMSDFDIIVRDTGTRLIAASRLFNISRIYCRGNEFRKRLVNDINSIIRKSKNIKIAAC